MLITNTEKEQELEKDQLLAIQLTLEKRMEDDLRRAISKAAVAAALKYESIQEPPSNFMKQHHQDDINSILNKNYKIIIDVNSSRNFKEIESMKSGPFRKDAISEFEILSKQWIAQEGLKEAKEISKTTMNDIISVILKGTEDGVSTNVIAKTILSKVGDQLAKSRSKVISITETHNAASWANLESTKQIDDELDLGLKKRWIPVEDSRTRPEHAAMRNVQAIGLEDNFIVGIDQMDRPGDSSAPAGQVVNCRCVLVFEE